MRAEPLVSSSHVDPWGLSSVPISNRDALPHCQGIYFALAHGQVLYIGKARNIRNRWRNHHRFGDLQMVEGVSIAWLSFEGSPAKLHSLERELIELHLPVLNNRPVFCRPEKTGSRQRKIGPKAWDERQTQGVGTFTYLDRHTINDLGENHKYLSPIGRGAWFPNTIVRLMIGPDYDSFESHDQWLAAKDASKQSWLAWMSRIRVFAESNDLPIETTLKGIADGTLKP